MFQVPRLFASRFQRRRTLKVFTTYGHGGLWPRQFEQNFVPPFHGIWLQLARRFMISAMTDFDIVKFPFLDGDLPSSTSYGVYLSQLIRFARVSGHVAESNARNKSLTTKFLQQGYRYQKLRKTFSKFYHRHYELVSKFNVGLKTLLYQCLSEPELNDPGQRSMNLHILILLIIYTKFVTRNSLISEKSTV